MLYYSLIINKITKKKYTKHLFCLFFIQLFFVKNTDTIYFVFAFNNDNFGKIFFQFKLIEIS